MKKEELKNLSKEQVLNFIRQQLKFDDYVLSSFRLQDESSLQHQHKRFDMSGYDNETGDCTLWNQSILNEFAYLGIYDYTHYLVVDFYKGVPTIYLRYFNTNEDYEIDDLPGCGTVEIIYRVFELTIFSGRNKRRRN